MIESSIIKIKKNKNLDNIQIENELSSMYSSIIRWAIVDIDDTNIVLSVAYIK